MQANRSGEIDFTCPECGRTFKKSVGEIERNPQFVCPNPSCDQGFDGSQFVKQLDGALNDAARQLRDAFKKLK